MKLNSLIQQELDRLADAKGERRLSANTSAGQLHCDFHDVNSLACSFDQLGLRANSLADATPEQLLAVGEALSKKMTYLLEPVSPIEVDADRCVVQLRSNPPSKDESVIRYYEVLVERAGEISLCRYQAERGEPRRVVPTAVTREVFQRLAGDMVTAVS